MGVPADLPAPPTAGAPGRAASLPRLHLEVRLRRISRLMLFALVALIAGFGYWQLVRNEEYTRLDRRQTLRRVPLLGARGPLYDREQRVLAETRATTALVISPRDLRRLVAAEAATMSVIDSLRDDVDRADARRPENLAWTLVLDRLAEQIGRRTGRTPILDSADLRRRIARDRVSALLLLDTLVPEEVARFSASTDSEDVLHLHTRHERVYPRGIVASHVLGRLRRERVHPAAEGPVPALSVESGVGESGVEKQHDAVLRGMPGEALLRLDAEGFAVGIEQPLRRADPGKPIILSLDLDIQQAAEQALATTPGPARGAAVALSVRTGEVLALASAPSVDVGASPRLSRKTKERLDAEGAWFNRATQGLYPPGSLFKIFTVAASLRAGSLRPEDGVQCDGHLLANGARLPCHNLDGHGPVTLGTALARSCNVYAYHAGLAAGPSALAAEAERFHFHQPTGIDLPFETHRMLVPSPSSTPAAQTRGPWRTGDTANLSIGQGDLRITPLQAACAIASLARRECLTVPTLLRQPDRRASGRHPPEPMGLSDADHTALIKAMRAVVESGIGIHAQVPGVTIAGKTGTSQIQRADGTWNIAWFVAFAPIEKPEIAVAVALEGPRAGVEFAGAEHAAPVVREVLGAYFDKRRL